MDRRTTTAATVMIALTFALGTAAFAQLGGFGAPEQTSAASTATQPATDVVGSTTPPTVPTATETAPGAPVGPTGGGGGPHTPAASGGGFTAGGAPTSATNTPVAADGDARLTWFYERTPFYDQRFRLYPVGREN